MMSAAPSFTWGTDVTNVITAPVRFTASTRSHWVVSRTATGAGGGRMPRVGEDTVERADVSDQRRYGSDERSSIGHVDAGRAHASPARASSTVAFSPSGSSWIAAIRAPSAIARRRRRARCRSGRR